jgi:hypothetical protein
MILYSDAGGESGQCVRHLEIRLVLRELLPSLYYLKGAKAYKLKEKITC